MNYKIEDMLSKLDRMKTFEHGWNGYSADPIDPKAISVTEKLLQYLPVIPFVSPTGRSTVQIEYRTPNHEYLEFEIYPDKIVRFCITISGEEEYTYYGCSHEVYMEIANDVKMFLY